MLAFSWILYLMEVEIDEVMRVLVLVYIPELCIGYPGKRGRNIKFRGGLPVFMR